MKKKERSPDSSDNPAETKKKKRIILRVRMSTKKAFGDRAPNFEAFYRLKDFPEVDDDMEFFTN